MTDSYIRKCPHCGHKAVIVKTGHGNRWTYKVDCLFCHCQTGEFDRAKDAIFRWNRRFEGERKWKSG